MAACSLALGCLLCSLVSAAPLISLVIDEESAPPARHGYTQLKLALQQKGGLVEETATLRQARGAVAVVAGLSTGAGEAARLMGAWGLAPLKDPESLLIRRESQAGKETILLAGADARGLMYALLDVAERVSWAKNSEHPFSEVRNTQEKPFTRERALSIYTMHQAYWESRFYNEDYWTRYFDLLARHRFNSFVVIFGYENGGFLAPAYPYFFNVAGFPEVRMVGLAEEQQRRNLQALNRLIQLAHDRGLSVTLGLWDHIYRGGVQGGGIPGAQSVPGQPTPGLVWGVTTTNLTVYTCAALQELLRLVPNLDAVQFRMHDESGLKNSEQLDFWRKIFRVMKENGPHIRFDARAKGLPDAVIESGLDLGVNLRLTTKYWMEQMGLPFHPTHINRENQFDRRHSYADLLRYPRRYHLLWRLWNGGTARVLLWADPDYARRFAESSRLYDGDGFEVNEPLCTKMEAQPHAARPFDLLRPAYRYYDYEFERYWHFFQVFGRLGYQPDAPPEIWLREFEQRFGQEAAPFVAAGLHRASQVLPRIVAACYPYSYFPMTRGWAEKQRLGGLAVYARAEGSDIQQFANFDEEAQLLITGGETARIRPPATSLWFAGAATDIFAQIAEAEKRIGQHRGREYASTLTDLKILANLALYHARRIPAAVNYRLFERTHDVHRLADAIAQEKDAIAAWRALVSAAGNVYHDDLMMGVRGASLCGHWRDELAELEKGLASLEQQRRDFKPPAEFKSAPPYQPVASAGGHQAPQVIHLPVASATAGQPLVITAEVSDPSGVKWVRLRYRSVNQQLDYRTLVMEPIGEKNRYRATIPAAHIPPGWDLMYFLEVMDQQDNGAIHPDLNQTTPYIVVHLRR